MQRLVTVRDSLELSIDSAQGEKVMHIQVATVRSAAEARISTDPVEHIPFRWGIHDPLCSFHKSTDKQKPSNWIHVIKVAQFP